MMRTSGGFCSLRNRVLPAGAVVAKAIQRSIFCCRGVLEYFFFSTSAYFSTRRARCQLCGRTKLLQREINKVFFCETRWAWCMSWRGVGCPRQGSSILFGACWNVVR